MRKRSRSTFQPNAFSGYTDYRYGSTKKVSLAPILKRERRDHVVHQVIDTLKDWQHSPFEHEADAFHGLRQGLCLDGHGFARAEAEAASVVAQAFRIIGTRRPSWEEGQRQFTDPPENCARCGGPLDQYRLKARFCSDVCARSFLEERNAEAITIGEETLAKARRLIYREHQKQRTCEHCGAAFRPMHGATKARFCSKRCMYAFRDTAAAAIYERVCEWCGTPFVSKLPKGLYCMPACQLKTSQIRTGKLKRISPPVFDYVFRMSS